MSEKTYVKVFIRYFQERPWLTAPKKRIAEQKTKTKIPNFVNRFKCFKEFFLVTLPLRVMLCSSDYLHLFGFLSSFVLFNQWSWFKLNTISPCHTSNNILHDFSSSSCSFFNAHCRKKEIRSSSDLNKQYYLSKVIKV